MKRDEMRRIARGWGWVVDAYVEELFDELDRKPADRELLAAFAARAIPGSPVADLGCGPGHVARYLHGLGLDVVGIDLCPEMVERARELTPEVRFEVGDMLSLDVEDGAWGGAIALYSLINLVRDDVVPALRGIARALQPGAPLLVAVHRGEDLFRGEGVFGKPLPMVVTLFEPDELAGMLEQAGFEVELLRVRPPYDAEYPSERIYALALRAP